MEESSNVNDDDDVEVHQVDDSKEETAEVDDQVELEPEVDKEEIMENSAEPEESIIQESKDSEEPIIQESNEPKEPIIQESNEPAIEEPKELAEPINSNELNVPQSDRVKTSDSFNIGTEENGIKFEDPINLDEIPQDPHVDILIIDQNEINEESEEELLSDKEIKSVQKEYDDEEFDDNDDVVVSPQRNLSADLSKPTRTGDSTKDEVSLS